MSQTKRMALGIQQSKKKNENLISKNLNKNLGIYLFFITTLHFRKRNVQ
jgi:hypothetical protein